MKPCINITSIAENLYDSKVVIQDLKNPRGIRLLDDGTILLAETGSGDRANPNDGRVLKYSPTNGTERVNYKVQEIPVHQQPSINMMAKMKRDEIMGLSEIAEGKDGQILVGLTDYISGSRVIEIFPRSGQTVFNAAGSINSIAYHPRLDAWFAIRPDLNDVIRLQTNKQEVVVAHIEDITEGQDAVPVCIVYEPNTDMFLITLFSGELFQDPSKAGIEFTRNAGKVIRVNPETGEISDAICGLNLPTGMVAGAQGEAFVLELCEDFLEPLGDSYDPDACLHGGFQRFSGRLLKVDMESGDVQLVADHLDTPSNITLNNNTLLVSEGMGIPGRLIPDANGKASQLSGYVRSIGIPGSA